MSDFLIGFDRVRRQRVGQLAPALRWYPDLKAWSIDRPEFALALTRADDAGLWGPYLEPENGCVVAMAGRVAFEERDLDGVAGDGKEGLVARCVWGKYRQDPASLHRLNGAFGLFLHDPQAGKTLVVTDRCGMNPVFACERDGLVLSTHPDLAAACAGVSAELDEVSVAEFLMTGRVSAPATYYKSVKMLQPGSVYEVLRDGDLVRLSPPRRYFTLQYEPERAGALEEMVEELGGAFRAAVARRSLPRYGKVGVALSGGLDSRTVLACLDGRADREAFTFFDEENYEFQIAARLAQAQNTRLLPLRRDFEHYGAFAAQGVRISGGMGNFENNHFLGFRSTLLGLGIGSLLTGFYCDYLFKGLGLDRDVGRLLGTDRLGRFSLQWYRPRFTWETPLCAQAVDRHQALFADISDRETSDRGRLMVEGRRLFPLAYEPDNAETTVAQRVMPWFLPTVDSELLAVYQRLPPAFKLNNAVYARMVARVCGSPVARIPDSNTGLPVGELGWRYVALNLYQAVARRVKKRLMPGMATRGSWPNWEFYVHHSEVLRQAWQAPAGDDAQVLNSIVGSNFLVREPRSFAGAEVELFTRCLTFRLWFHQRVR